MDTIKVGDAVSDQLYPALFQCFTIILCGYIAGRLNVVTKLESKGIATFVGTFALPSLIFLSLARLDFSTVNWTFLLSILLAKGLVFFAVIVITLLVSKPMNLGQAGIFAIFCTQSNDFALGYPIINAIYEKSHPEYALYLYLMAPISLAILNPVAFVLMELHKQGQSTIPEIVTSQSCRKLKMLLQLIKGIVFNPVLVMTILGIIGNIAFKHKLSIYIEGLLDVFGQSFSAAALFLLGLRMVGQITRLRGAALVLPCVLIMVKLICLPVIMREFVSALHSGANDTETQSLSTYAFLYGTIPTAPAVFVFSNLYNLEIDLMASSMVICTFVSAPITFLSAQVISINQDYAEQIKRFGFDLSIVALIAALWVFIVFTFTRKYKRVPHKLTLCLNCTQILLAVAVLWGGPVEPAATTWRDSAQQALLFFAMFSCLAWTAMLSVGLFMLETRGPCFVVTLFPVLAFVAWGAPAVMVGSLLITKGGGPINADAADAIRLSALFFCIMVTVGCLTLYMRNRVRYSQNSLLSSQDDADHINEGETANLIENGTANTQSETLSNFGCYGTITSSPRRTNCCTNDPACDSGQFTANSRNIEDMANDERCGACASGGGGACAYAAQLEAAAGALGLLPPETSRGRGGQLLKHTVLLVAYSFVMFIYVDNTLIVGGGGACSYAVQLEAAAGALGLLPPETFRGRGGQLLRHTVLLVAYSFVMFIGLTFTAWRMMRKDESGVFIEIQFLDTAATYGQALLMFVLFGLDPQELMLPVVRYFQTQWYGTDKITLPPVEDLSFETKLVCEQFITHHLERCKNDIAKDTRWRVRTYRGVFRGSCLVKWLVRAGLAADSAAATAYARHLLDGRLIAHVNNAHHFADSPLLYTFL